MLKRKKILISTLLILNFSFLGANQQYLDFLKNFFNPGDLVFDIGANNGSKSEAYLANDARVVCVEPQPKCVEILHRKFKGNQSVTIEKKAVGAISGETTLYICSQAPTISSCSKEFTESGRFFERNFKWDQQIRVDVVTLDQLIKFHGLPTYCKIDVENFEYEVLKGLTQPIKYISFEINIEFFETFKKCIQLLSTLGYKLFNFAEGEYSGFIFSHWLSDTEIILEIESYAANPKTLWGLWGDVYAYYNEFESL